MTVDALATIGDVAGRLLGVSAADRGSPTLSVRFPGDDTSRVLNPLLSISESPLRSGATVGVIADANRWTAAASVPVAEAEVVAGADVGKRFVLNAGANFVGSDEAC